MRTPLFDAFCGCLGFAPGARECLTAAQLVAELRRVDIGRALVRIVPERFEMVVPHSNDRLYAACAAHPELVPCPVVAPAAGADVPSEDEQAAAAVAGGAGAVWIRPAVDYWGIAAWLSGPLFSALSRRRLPVICAEHLVGLSQVAEIAAGHAELPLIVVGASYRVQRTLLPLLQRFPNVYLSLGAAYAVQGGIEQLVAAVGAERLLFGTGLPECEAMAAITYLMYADLDGVDRRLIGSGNLERLMKEIQ